MTLSYFSAKAMNSQSSALVVPATPIVCAFILSYPPLFVAFFPLPAAIRFSVLQPPIFKVPWLRTALEPVFMPTFFFPPVPSFPVSP